MSNGAFEQQGSVAGMPPELFSFFLKQLGIEPEFAGVGPTIGIPNPTTGQGTFTGQPSAGATAPAPTTGQGTLANPKRNLSPIRALSLIAVPVLNALAAGQRGPRRGRNRAFRSSLLAGGAQQLAQEVGRPRQEMLENLKVMADIARARAAQRVGSAAQKRATTAAAAPKFKPGTPVKARTKAGEEIFIQRNTKTGKFEVVPGFRPPLAKPSGTRRIKTRRDKKGAESLFIETKPGSGVFEPVTIIEGPEQEALATPGAAAAPATAAQPAAPGAAAPAVTPAPGAARVPFVSAPKPVKAEKRSTTLKVDASSGNWVLFNTQTGKVIKDTGVLGREPKDDKDAERIRTETNALRVISIAIKQLAEEKNPNPTQAQINNKALDIIEARVRRRPTSGAIAGKLRKAIRDITRRRLGKEGLLQILAELERRGEF